MLPVFASSFNQCIFFLEGASRHFVCCLRRCLDCVRCLSVGNLDRIPEGKKGGGRYFRRAHTTTFIRWKNILEDDIRWEFSDIRYLDGMIPPTCRDHQKPIHVNLNPQLPPPPRCDQYRPLGRQHFPFFFSFLPNSIPHNSSAGTLREPDGSVSSSRRAVFFFVRNFPKSKKRGKRKKNSPNGSRAATKFYFLFFLLIWLEIQL